MIEKKYRSFAKALSWRVTATCTTIIISLLVIGHIGAALTIGGFEVVTKIFLYYFHERIWGMVKFGVSEPVKANTVSQDLLNDEPLVQ